MWDCRCGPHQVLLEGEGSRSFEKDLMRADAIDFKDGSVSVVDVIEPEVGPVLAVMNGAESANRSRASGTVVRAARIATRRVGRGATCTATGANAVANLIIMSPGDSEGTDGRRTVTRILEANPQHLLERDGMAFIDVHH
jgi:hypothetical protein